MDTRLSSQWFDPLFRAEAMRRIFSDFGRLQGMLDFEAGLARAQARAGAIPEAAARSIPAQCHAEHFNMVALSQASAQAGNSAIPVIKELTRLVADVDPAAAQFVHWVATSQDAMDTGLVLQMRSGLDLIDADAQQLWRCPGEARLRTQANADRRPNLAAARRSDNLRAQGRRLAVRGRPAGGAPCVLRPHLLVLQLGGAVGTLAAMGEHAEKPSNTWPKNSGFLPRKCPGTRSATGWWKSPRRWGCWSARWAKSHGISG